MLAYIFTNVPIAKALIQAHKPGVDVRVILDAKMNDSMRKYSAYGLFKLAGIPVFTTS